MSVYTRLARLQGVAIVAGYEPPVQHSDFGRRDPRFCSSPTETRIPTPPRVSLELVHHAPTDTVSRVGPDRVKLALYASQQHTLRCMPPGQKHAYLASHPTDNRPCEKRPQFTVASGFSAPRD
jgi:hypothetical protein